MLIFKFLVIINCCSTNQQSLYQKCGKSSNLDINLCAAVDECVTLIYIVVFISHTWLTLYISLLWFNDPVVSFSLFFILCLKLFSFLKAKMSRIFELRTKNSLFWNSKSFGLNCQCSSRKISIIIGAHACCACEGR